LTPAQLAAFVARPTTAVEIARQYTLDARDLARLRRRRGAHNRMRQNWDERHCRPVSRTA